MDILVKAYRKLPASFRNYVYHLFLERILYIIRNPNLFIQNKFLKLGISPYVKMFRGKNGIEIGGPSSVFSKGKEIPIYAVCQSVDGCNFSNSTVWEGDITANKYQYKSICLGTQYICEASELADAISGKEYDFIISSNCLEHVANPLKAINSWLKHLKPTGLFLLIVPNKKSNFDHNRPDTLFEHLLQDYEQAVTEDDMTHYDEIMQLHDLTKDLGAKDRYTFEQRSLQNKQNRCLHHHIFNPNCLNQLFEHVGLSVLYTKSTCGDHIILGRKK